MGAVLTLVDEHFGRGRDDPFEIHLASERTTGRELIAKRVSDEIALLEARARSNSAAHERTRSFLVRFDPSSPEAQLNEATPRRSKPITYDEREEVAAAEAAFAANKFVMLFDDAQVEDLDQALTVTPTSELIFLRLVPLIGG